MALDFELYNSLYYWTICWVGCVVVDNKFNNLTAPFDIKVNPVVKKLHVGKGFKFPFTGAEIRQEKLFGEIAPHFIKYLDKKTLVIGHAFENDARMLIDACHKYNIKCPSFDYIDTNILYNALKGTSGEHSLTKLATEYGIEFTAHDPLEDAMTTLEVAKNIIKDDGLYKFLSKYKIEPSKVENNLIYRGGAGMFNAERNAKITRFNVAFNSSYKNTKPTKTFNFDNNIISEQNLSAVSKAFGKKGYAFCGSKFVSDINVTNNLYMIYPSGTMSFRQLVEELNIKGQFDYSPKKVFDETNNPMTLDEYYESKYLEFIKNGDLNGKGVAFSKCVENSANFDAVCRAIVGRGGKIRFNVGNANFLIVESMQELQNKKDGRIRFYNRNKKETIFIVDNFLKQQN